MHMAFRMDAGHVETASLRKEEIKRFPRGAKKRVRPDCKRRRGYIPDVKRIEARLVELRKIQQRKAAVPLLRFSDEHRFAAVRFV
ncbi:MAG: hypothetical protein LBS72_07705 [Oscillospiraceae bacterium]|nr:hypothetical protein [Oscillospiraceae bacterium]